MILTTTTKTSCLAQGWRIQIALAERVCFQPIGKRALAPKKRCDFLRVQSEQSL